MRGKDLLPKGVIVGFFFFDIPISIKSAADKSGHCQIIGERGIYGRTEQSNLLGGYAHTGE